MHGTFETLDGRPALLFERRLDHPPAKVWDAVTQPEGLDHWFPAAVDYEPTAGAEMTFTFRDGDHPVTHGEVIDFDPPRRFAFTWSDAEIRIELEPRDSGCLLRFTHVFEAEDQAARDAAGWHVCLERLERALAGEAVAAPGTEMTDRHRELYAKYLDLGLPSGAPVPD